MPFVNIPKNADGFKKGFNYLQDPIQQKVLKLMLHVNELFEAKSNEIQVCGSFLYYDDLVFARSVKRGSGFYFWPTETMKRPVKMNNISPELLDKILSIGRERCQPVHDGIFWEFLTKPGEIWTSSLSQAFALELFSHDEDYWNICDRILKGFATSWKKGGVCDCSISWYLEYPMYVDDKKGIRRVLNGHVDALLMLYRYYEKSSSETAKLLFDSGEYALKTHLSQFLSPEGKTYYSYWQATNQDPSIREKSYNERYHNLHVTQIYRMYTITKDEFYRDMYTRMMTVKNSSPYYLTPYTVKIIEARDPKKSCPDCKVWGSCNDCLLKSKEV